MIPITNLWWVSPWGRCQLQPMKGTRKSKETALSSSSRASSVCGCDKCGTAGGGTTARPGVPCPCQLTHYSTPNIIIIDICIHIIVIANDSHQKAHICDNTSQIVTVQLCNCFSKNTSGRHTITRCHLPDSLTTLVISTLPNLSIIALIESTLAKFC